VTLKSWVKTHSPAFAVRAYRRAAIAREYARDCRDYARSTDWEAGSAGRSAQIDRTECAASRLILASHGLEKGATLPRARRPFGHARRRQIERILASPEQLELLPDWLVDACRIALGQHAAFNATGVICDDLTPPGPERTIAYPVERVEAFVDARHSVRSFDMSRPLERNLLVEAVRIAGRTPSVCNRRSYRAHLIDDHDSVMRALDMQNGSAGFRDRVPALFIITERRSAFIGAGERNQRWVDGGLFAMTLVWVLHALGLDTCFLNWSQPNAVTDGLRAQVGISVSEDIVVMIAVGHAARGYRVARSLPRPLNDILTIHD
jgi:hypothetical protein